MGTLGVLGRLRREGERARSLQAPRDGAFTQVRDAPTTPSWSPEQRISAISRSPSASASARSRLSIRKDRLAGSRTRASPTSPT